MYLSAGVKSKPQGSVKSELRSLKCFKFHSGATKHVTAEKYPLSESNETQE